MTLAGTGCQRICTPVPPGFAPFSSKRGVRGGFAQGGSPHDLHTNAVQCRPMPCQPEKPNEINHRRGGAKPVSISVTAPVPSRWANPLFYRVCRLGDRSQRRFLAEQDGEPFTLRRSMKSPEIAKTQ